MSAGVKDATISFSSGETRRAAINKEDAAAAGGLRRNVNQQMLTVAGVRALKCACKHTPLIQLLGRLNTGLGLPPQPLVFLCRVAFSSSQACRVCEDPPLGP